jgi:hypothetical protein
MTSIATPLAMRKKMYTLNNIGLRHLGSMYPGLFTGRKQIKS